MLNSPRNALPSATPMNSTPTSSLLSVGKFQRTSRNSTTVPEDNNPFSEPSESLISVEQPPRILTRTNKLKTQQISPQAFIKKSQSPPITALSASKSASQLQPPVILRRSTAVAQTMGRLLKGKYRLGLEKLRAAGQSGGRKVSEGRSLLLAAGRLNAVCYLSWLREGIARFKMTAARKLKDSHQVDAELMKSNTGKTRDTLPILLQWMFRNRMRYILTRFRAFKVNSLRREKAVPVLGSFLEHRKLREAFVHLRERSWAVRRAQLLGLFSKSHKSLSRRLLSQPYWKLQLMSFSNQGRTQYEQKIEEEEVADPRKVKLQSAIEQLNEAVQQAQSTMARRKKQTDIESRKLQKTVDQKQQVVAQAQKITNQRKKKNLQYKQQIEQANNPTGPEDESGSHELAQLAKIYTHVSNNPEPDIGSLPLEDKETPLVAEWKAIHTRSQLQKQIELYESVLVGQRPAPSGIGKSLREENELVKSMVRNYLRERYLWHEVGRYVSAILPS